MTHEEKRRILVEYLKMKAESEDWHGVADAACDLRELDAAERVAGSDLNSEGEPS